MNERHLENIIEGVLVAHRSAIWWQTEMNKALSKLNKLEQEDDLYGTVVSEEREELERHVEYLITKGQWEDDNLEQIMKTVDFFNAAEKKHVISEVHKRWLIKQMEKSQNDTPPPEDL